MAGERRRIEANADVARPLSQIRQAYDLHANNQLGPGGVPDVWTALHRSHWSHAWRLHVSQSSQPVGLPAADSNDQRDFVEFLRRQLAPAELDFALFVVFRDHRNFMRSQAGQEVRRRYQALRGNVGNYSEDDIAFELGTAVVRSTPSLRVLNNLLSPRDPAAQRFLPAVVFSAVRDEMLLRHQDPAHPPSVTTADVTNAALRLRPNALSASVTPAPLPQAGAAQGGGEEAEPRRAVSQPAVIPGQQQQQQAQAQAQTQDDSEAAAGAEAAAAAAAAAEAEAGDDAEAEAQLQGEDQQVVRKRTASGAPEPARASRRRRLDQAHEDDEEDDESLPRSESQAEPSQEPEPQQQQQPQQQQPQRQHQQQQPEPQPEPEVEPKSEPKEDEEPQPRDDEGEDPEFGRRESSSAFTDPPSPRLRARGITSPIPQFSPLVDTPRTPPLPPPAQPPFGDSPNVFATPPERSLVIPPEARPSLLDELGRWQEIVRLVREMPDPQGTRLWRETVATAVQAVNTVSIWVDDMLDEEAMRDTP